MDRRLWQSDGASLGSHILRRRKGIDRAGCRGAGGHGVENTRANGVSDKFDVADELQPETVMIYYFDSTTTVVV